MMEDNSMKESQLTIMKKSRITKIRNAEECRIVKRLNRFVVEIMLGDKNYRASINNTGRLKQFLVEGGTAYCIPQKKGNKTDYKLFAVKDGDAGAVIDTRLQMDAFERVLHKGLIPWLKDCTFIRRDARLNGSVIDYMLECNGSDLYLEVKSAVLRNGSSAMYPDCPTARGRRHIAELTEYVRAGGQATILFIAALDGVSSFKPDKDSDPELYYLLVKAVQAGVGTKAINMIYQPEDSYIYLAEADMMVLI
jgi:sugar fermentation stimulation protein A